QEIPQHFPGVALDEFVIMPNHVHGIIVINNKPRHISNFQHVAPGSLGVIVRGFKSAVTRWFHAHTQIKTVWPRNFYDHVVRDESELNRIRLYVQQNPARWEFDRLNQQSAGRVREPAIIEFL
ncbi:MAG: transposase, partial [Erysipelotrichia bacterium]|nr:transposase [Erysipelotrichia bacterium]